MKKIIIILLLISMSGVLSGCVSSGEGKTLYFDEDGNSSTTKPKPKVADKLEVYYFHRTARCYSCNTMGDYVKNLINGRYAKQVKDGKIIFRELNAELPENREIAGKYRASGSSLFINRITDGQDKIEQDVNVWRMLGDEAGFNEYLGEKIDSYLGL